MLSLLLSKRTYLPLIATLCIPTLQIAAQKEVLVVQPSSYNVVVEGQMYTVVPSSQPSHKVAPAPTPSSTHTAHQATEWGLHKPITQLISHGTWPLIAFAVANITLTVLIAFWQKDQRSNTNKIPQILYDCSIQAILPQLGLFTTLYTILYPITAFAPGFVSYFLTTLFAGAVLCLLKQEKNVISSMFPNSTLALLLSIALGAFLYVAFKDKKTKILGAILQGCLAGALAFTAVYGVREALASQTIEERTYSQLIPGYTHYKKAYDYFTVGKVFYPWIKVHKNVESSPLLGAFFSNLGAFFSNKEQSNSPLQVIQTITNKSTHSIIQLAHEKTILLPYLYQGLKKMKAPDYLAWALIVNTLTAIAPPSYLLYISTYTFFTFPVVIYALLPFLLL